MAGVAPCTAARRGGEEQSGATPLRRRQRAVLSGQEPIPGRVSCDDRAHEGGRRPDDGEGVDEIVTSARNRSRLWNASCRHGGLRGKRVAEELPIDGDLLQHGRLEAHRAAQRIIVQEPVSVEQQESHVLLRRMVERVEGTVRLVGLAGEPPEQEAVVEGGSDDAQWISRDAVQGIESTGCQQPNRGRPGICRISRQRAATPGWSVHFDRAVREQVDVCQRGQRVYQRVAREERGLPQDR